MAYFRFGGRWGEGLVMEWAARRNLWLKANVGRKSLKRKLVKKLSWNQPTRSVCSWIGTTLISQNCLSCSWEQQKKRTFSDFVTSRRNLEQFILSCPDNSGTGHFCLWKRKCPRLSFFELPAKLFFQFKSFFNKRIDSEVEFRTFPEVSQRVWTIAWPFLAPANTVHFAFVLLYNPETFTTLVAFIFSNTRLKISPKNPFTNRNKILWKRACPKVGESPGNEVTTRCLHCMFFQLRLSGRYVGASQCRAQGDAWLTNGTTWSTSRRLHKREWQTGDIPHISSFSNIAPAALRPIPFDDNLLLDLKQTLSIKDHHRSLVIFNPCVREVKEVEYSSERGEEERTLKNFYRVIKRKSDSDLSWGTTLDIKPDPDLLHLAITAVVMNRLRL